MARRRPDGFIELSDGRLLNPNEESVQAMCELAALCQPQPVSGGGFRLGGGGRGSSGPQGSSGTQGVQGPAGTGGGGGGGGCGGIIPFTVFESSVTSGGVFEGTLQDNGSLQTFPTPSTRIPLPVGTAKDFRTFIQTGQNTLDGDFVVTVFKNGVATALTLTYPAGTDGAMSLATDVAFAANDQISFVMDTTDATSGNVQSIDMSSLFSPSGCESGGTLYSLAAPDAANTASAEVREINPGTDIHNSPSFPNPLARIPVAQAGKLRRLVILVTSNTTDNDTIFTVLADGAATPLTLTFAAATTGLQSIDSLLATIGVSAAVGDGFSVQVDTSASTAGDDINWTGSFEYIPD